MPDGEGYRPVDEEPLLGQAKDFPPDYEPEPDSGETVDAAEPADSLEAEGAMEEPDAKAAVSPFPVQKIDFQGGERAAGVDEAGEEEADGDASAEAIIEAAMAEVQAEDGEEGAEAAGATPVKGEGGAPADAESPLDVSDMPALPKRATSGFTFFLREVYGGRPSREAGDAWKALSEEAKAPYQERHAADKARYEQEMQAYKRYLAEHPELGAAAAAADDEIEPTVSVLPVAKVRRMMKVANLTPSTSLAKEAVFLVSKSAETFLQMLTEQAVHAARAGKRKKIGVPDFEQARLPSSSPPGTAAPTALPTATATVTSPPSPPPQPTPPPPSPSSHRRLEQVLYGSRNADLLDFLHGDFPKQARRATPVKTRAAPKPKRAKPAKPEAEGEEAEEGEEAAAGKENDKGAKRQKAKAAAAAEKPVQSTTMHHFFGAKPDAGPEEAAPAARARARADEDDELLGEDVGARGGRRMVEEDDEEDDEEAPEAADDAEAQAAPQRKRRLALVSDDESDEADS